MIAQHGVVTRRTFLAGAVGAAAAAWCRIGRGDSALSLARAAPASAPGAPGRGRWIARAAMPFPRTEISVTGLDGKVYVVGGYAHGRVDQPFIQVYDPAADAWRDLTPMPRGLNHVGVVGSNNRIYSFGGFFEQNRNAVTDSFEYDVRENRWRRIAPLRAKRGAIFVVDVGGKLHLIGGRDEHSLPIHEVYDPTTDSYSPRAPLPDGRDHIGHVVFAGKIHAIGGRFNTFANNTHIHNVYDAATDAWSYRAPMPTARSGMAGAVMAGRIFMIGGEETGRVFHENEVYDPATDRWTSMLSMQTPRHGTNAVTVGDAIYVPGGGLTVGGAVPTAIHEAFRLA